MKSPQETILTLLIIGERFQLTRTLFPIFQLDIIQTNWNCHLVYPSGSKLSIVQGMMKHYCSHLTIKKQARTVSRQRKSCLQRALHLKNKASFPKTRLTPAVLFPSIRAQHQRRGSQVVRRRSAKSLFAGSIPAPASKMLSKPVQVAFV